VAAAQHVAGRLHQPGYAFSMFRADPIPPKPLLATIALAPAGLQVLLALWIWRKLPPAASPPRPVPATHRVTGFTMFPAHRSLLTVPVAVHCLITYGAQPASPRVAIHTIAGCCFYRAFAANVPLGHSRQLGRASTPTLATGRTRRRRAELADLGGTTELVADGHRAAPIRRSARTAAVSERMARFSGRRGHAPGFWVMYGQRAGHACEARALPPGRLLGQRLLRRVPPSMTGSAGHGCLVLDQSMIMASLGGTLGNGAVRCRFAHDLVPAGQAFISPRRRSGAARERTS